MKEENRLAVRILGGAAYAALILLAAQGLIRNLVPLIQFIARTAEMGEDTIGMIEKILGQLNRATVASPWIPALFIGTAAGALLSLLPARKWVRGMLILLGVVLFVPLVAAALWFTAVNGIQLGTVIRILLPMVKALI